MFQVTVRDMDKDAAVVANFTAEKFVVVTQNGNQVNTSYSSTDFVDKFGLLEFAKKLVEKDLVGATPASVSTTGKGGVKNA